MNFKPENVNVSGNYVVPVILHFLFLILTKIIIKDKNYIWFEILCNYERENCPIKTHVFSGLTLPPFSDFLYQAACSNKFSIFRPPWF